MQMQDKKEREDVIAKENDKAKILRLEKELMALKKQKATWEAKSVCALTEDPPESEREKVTVNMFGSDVKVKNEKFLKFKKTAQYDHKKQWLHHEVCFFESSYITHSTGRRRALARRPPQGP